MGIFGKGANVSTQSQRISSFQVNQSSYGVPLKLVFGTALVNSVLVDYQDFTAIATTTTTTSGGKGGGKTTSSQTTYTYTVAGCLGLGEGELAGVGQVYSGSKTTDLYSLNLQFFNGEKAQDAWGYMVTKHPDHALTYSGTSYVAGVVDLGDSASLPNMNFEVYGLCQDQAPPQYIEGTETKSVTATKTSVSISGDDYMYDFNTSFTIDNFYAVKSIVVNGNNVVNESHSYSITDDTVNITGSFYAPGSADTYTVAVTLHYAKAFIPTLQKPTNKKMQQFAYTKEIEISNFSSNRYVEEYVFDSATSTGSWQTLDSRYYSIEQSKDQYGNVKAGVYTYTFNFDERDDGYDRADPTYIRIYYTAIQATVDYTPTDANPRDIIYTLLTSTVYGENFPDVLIDEESLAVYSNYCKTNSLLLSPVYGDQTSCSDIISSLMECTNSEYVFSQGKAKVVPYWDGLTPNYAITDSNIINQSEETLRIERTSQADTYNIIPLEHTSRADQYNSNVVYATDEGDIELHGVRQAGTYSHPEIMNQSLAQAVAQLILQKQLYNRNRYTVKLGQEFILLEPMDACTLQSDLANLGLTTVRVVEIKESTDDYTLEITFEDNLSGITTAPSYATQDSDRAVTNVNVDPQSTNTPIIFEAPSSLVESATGYEVWIYASGNNQWWGGCGVWLSNDGNSYKLVGTIKSCARQGVITNELPVHATPDEDTVLGVDLSMSRGNLTSGTREDADKYITLCWVAGNNNGEFISYQNAELTAQYKYNLSYLRRGVYGSSIQTHSANTPFVRCDLDRVLKIPFNAKDIGTTMYVKLTSFNTYGEMEQDLSEVEPTIYTVHGYNVPTVIESDSVSIVQNQTVTVNYNHTYQSAPYPQITNTTPHAGDSLTISNTTATSFDVTYTNSDNDPDVSGETYTATINYFIYGK